MSISSPLRPIIVFDLDGTLIDTATDLVTSINHVLATEGLRAVDRKAFGGLVGMGGRAMIERAYTMADRRVDAEVIERNNQLFLEHYAAGIPGLSRPYPGVLEAIERSRRDGFVFAICTNKPEAMARSLVERLGISGLFNAITGGDTYSYKKPDPRHLLETIELARGDARRSIMVGDSRTDIDTAKAAGIPVVAVDFGYTDRHVREFEPSAIISHYDELQHDLIDRLLTAAGA